MILKPSQRKPSKPRWFRFGLKTALFTTLVCAICLAIVMPIFHQRTVMAKLRSFSKDVSFAVFFDYQERPKRIGYDHWDLEADHWAPEWLGERLGDDAFGKPVFLTVHYYRRNDGQFLDHVNQLQTWKHIDFGGTAIKDEMLAKLTGMPKLKRIRLDETSISDNGCKTISQFGSLDEIHLSKSKLTDRGLAELGKLPRLTLLFLANCNVTGIGFEEFQNADALKRLDLMDSNLSDESGKALACFKNLETLLVYRTGVTDRWLQEIGGLPKVTWFSFSETPISGTGYSSWPVSEKPVRIGLNNTEVTDENLTLIKRKFPNSTISSVSNTKVTRASLPLLIDQPRLTSLGISGFELLDEDIDLIATATELRYLSIAKTQITVIQLNKLLALKNLSTLNVRDCPNLDDRAFKFFRQLPLTELDVSTAQYSKKVIDEYEKEFGYQELTSGVIFTAWSSSE